MSDAFLLSTASMGTVVTIHIVGGESPTDRTARQGAAERALAWFREVEGVCSRFEPGSELSQLASHIGEPVPVSAMLFTTVRFALAVAEESDGAFDPTLGSMLEAAGFDREYRSGSITRVAPTMDGGGGATYRDVELDAGARTITLRRPLLLDLGAVAKGLAIDMAVKQLIDDGYENFAVDAGGDLYLAGTNAEGEPWSVGIRHPRREGEMIESLRVSNAAVCTSGDYERRTTSEESRIEHHIIDPRIGASATRCASVTTLAPSAMVADALGTAAFVLGPIGGLALLERHGIDAVIITPDLERVATAGAPVAGRVYRCVSPANGSARAS